MKGFVVVLAVGLLAFCNGCETERLSQGGKHSNSSSQIVRIDGAFGLRLGDVFDTSMGKKQNSISPQLSYTFTPTNRVRNFEWYSVKLTPKELRICTILAIANFKSRMEADVEVDVLMKILQDKYGREWNPDGPAASVMRSSGMRAIRRGNRSIVAKVHNDGQSAQVILSFRDEALEKAAEKEAIRELDKTGL